MKEIKMLLFLVVIFTVCTLFLTAGRYFFNRASAVFNRRLYAEIMDMHSLAYSQDNIDEDFEKYFRIVPSGDAVFYISEDPLEKTIGFKSQGPGLWSIIEVYLSFKMDDDELYGMRVLSQGETPGLGARISEQAFMESFRDLYIIPKVKIVKFSLAANEVDAISGATKTSMALEEIINNAIAVLNQNLEYLKSQGGM